MAVTSTISLSSATVNAEQKTTAALVVSNSGADTVYVNDIRPLVTPHSGTSGAVACQFGLPGLGGAFSSSVAASGTRTFYFDVIPHAPPAASATSAEAQPSQFVYDVGAVVMASDGTSTSPSVTTLTVNYIGSA